MSRPVIYVLLAIILLNVIAIFLLQNRLPEETLQPPLGESIQQEVIPAAQNVKYVQAKPLVRTIIFEDRQLCPRCFDIEEYVAELSELLNMSTETAPRELFNVTVIPSIAFGQTINEYPGELTSNWNYYGKTITIEEGEYEGTWYVLPSLNPPLHNLETGKTEGLVKAIFITMESCDECYDPEINKMFADTQRMVIAEEEFVDADSSEGKILIDRYGITAVPTVIFSNEAAVYRGMGDGWSAVGTREADGYFVLRDMQRLGLTYYDLQQEKVLAP